MTDNLDEQQASARVVVWPFSSGRLTNGGDHRATQIVELLSRNDRVTKVVDILAEKANGWRFWLHLMLRLVTTLQLPYRFPRGWKTYGADALAIRNQLRPQLPADCLVWEATGEPKTAKLLRPKVPRLIITPQNIESLGAQSSGELKKNFQRFRTEITAYSLADEVFTISEEEMWMLRLFGISSSCLPYYPPQELMERLLKIRSARVSTAIRNSFLVLGSMSNPPTRDGMLELVDWLTSAPAKNRPPIAIAGNQTDQLNLVSHPPNVSFLGRVSDEELDQLRCTSRGMIVHQRPTTGVITRITEAVISGIPVFANPHAARGHLQTEGVYVYRNRQELFDLLDQNQPDPPVPSRPDFEEQQFLNAVFKNGSES